MKRRFSKRLAAPIVTLALPIMLQGVLMNLMGFVDSLMIGQLGELVISALGNTQQLLGFLFLLMAAISIGGSVLIAQNKGASQAQKLNEVACNMITFGLFAGTLLGVLLFFYGDVLIALLTTDLFRAVELRSEVPATAMIYLRIVAVGVPFMLVNQMLSASLNSVGDTATPVKVGVFFNVVNFGLNYALIFGLGFPGLWAPLFTPLGFMGAAIATLIASVSQAIVMYVIARKKDNGLQLHFGELFRWRPKVLKEIVVLGYPNTVDGFYWQGARVFYTMLMNAIGAIAYAAYAIVRTIKGLFMLPIGGLQTATAIRIGHLLGAGQFRRAKATAMMAIIVGVAIMSIPAILLILFAKPLLSLYAIQPETEQLAYVCTWILSASLFFTAVNAVIPGLLRAGGDAKAVMNITLMSFVFCGAPLSWLLGVYFKLGLIGAFAGISMEEVFKAALFVRRMKQGLWLKQLVKKQAA